MGLTKVRLFSLPTPSMVRNPQVHHGIVNLLKISALSPCPLSPPLQALASRFVLLVIQNLQVKNSTLIFLFTLMTSLFLTLISENTLECPWRNFQYDKIPSNVLNLPWCQYFPHYFQFCSRRDCPMLVQGETEVGCSPL